MPAGQKAELIKLLAVVADGLDRAAFHRFFALGFFFGRGGLFENVGITAVVVSGEIGRGSFAAQITIDALVIDVIFARRVFWIFICDVSHKMCCLCWQYKCRCLLNSSVYFPKEFSAQFSTIHFRTRSAHRSIAQATGLAAIKSAARDS
jgi:hypothetical protein